MPANSANDITHIVTTISDLRPRLNPDLLDVFLAELLTWNPQLGLVSKRNTSDVVARLIRNSVDMWEFVANHTSFSTSDSPWRVVDIGSGGGFPGIVWKLWQPELDVTLIERKSRSAVFLERVITRLDLEAIVVVDSDLRDIVRVSLYPHHFDLAVMLAVASPGKIGSLVEALLNHGGYLVSLRASTEAVSPVVGTRLHLQMQTHTDSGLYLLYQRR